MALGVKYLDALARYTSPAGRFGSFVDTERATRTSFLLSPFPSPCEAQAGRLLPLLTPQPPRRSLSMIASHPQFHTHKSLIFLPSCNLVHRTAVALPPFCHLARSRESRPCAVAAALTHGDRSPRHHAALRSFRGSGNARTVPEAICLKALIARTNSSMF